MITPTRAVLHQRGQRRRGLAVVLVVILMCAVLASCRTEQDVAAPIEATESVCALLGTSVEGISVPVSDLYLEVFPDSDTLPVGIALTPGSDPSLQAQLELELSSDSAVASFEFLDQQENAAKARETFENSPLLSDYASTLDTRTFDVRVFRPIPPDFADRYRQLPGVRSVHTAEAFAIPNPEDQLLGDSRPLPNITFGELLTSPYLFDRLKVFLQPGASETEVAAIASIIDAHPEARRVAYTDAKTAVEEIIAIGGPGFSMSEDQAPTSFRILITDPREAQDLKIAVEGNHAVRSAHTASPFHKLGHLAAAVSILDQPELEALTSQLAEEDIGLDFLTDANDSLKELPSQWATIGDWNEVLGDTGLVTEDMWADAVAKAEAIQDTMALCGFEVCTVGNCTHLFEEFFPNFGLGFPGSR